MLHFFFDMMEQMWQLSLVNILIITYRRWTLDMD